MPESKFETIKPSFPKWLLAVFIISALIVILGGYLFYQSQKNIFLAGTEGEINSLVFNKVSRIVRWRENILANANEIGHDPFLEENVSRWFTDRDALTAEKLSVYLKNNSNFYTYKQTLLTDIEGNVCLGDSALKLPEKTLQLLKTAVSLQNPVIGSLYISDEWNTPFIDVAVPLYSKEGGIARSIGAVILRIDPDQFLYPMIQSWSAAMKTNEIVLFCRDGDDILFLNKSRFQKDDLLKFRIPLSRTETTEEEAVLGKRGIIKGRDYRGVRVVSVIESVPESSWFLEAKIDTSELRAAGLRQAWLPIAVVFGFLIVISVVIGWLWQITQNQNLQAFFNVKMDNLVLAKRYEHLVKYANDMFVLTDDQGRIIEANEKMLETFGYSREEITTMSIPDLLSPEELSGFAERLKVMDDMGFSRAEGINRKKDGTFFPVEYSVQKVTIDSRQYFQGILRDITEHKRNEEAIRSSQEKFNKAFQTAPALIAITSIEPEKIIDVNESFLKTLGFTREEVIGHTSRELNILSNYQQRKEIMEKLAMGNGPVTNVEVDVQTKDGRIRKGLFSVDFIELGGKKCLLTLMSDMTEVKRIENALRESEDKFKYVFDNSVIGKSITLVSGEINANKALCDMLGYTLAELNALKWQDITHTDDIALTQENLNLVLFGKKESVRFVKRFVRKDGAVIWVDLSTSVRLDNQGTPLYFMSSVIDITERKKAEEALRESEERFKAIAETTPVGISVARISDRQFLYVNAVYEKSCGYSAGELLNHKVLDVYYSAQDRDKVLTLLKNNNNVADAEIKLKRKDGNPFWVMASVRPITFGGEAALLGVFIDISERKKAEELVKDAAHQWSATFDAISDGICLLDRNSNVLRCNAAMTKLTGKFFNDTVGKKCHEAIHNQVERLKDCPVMKATLSRRREETEALVNNRWFRVTADPLINEKNELAGFVHIMTDITEQKTARENLRISEERYRTLFETAAEGIFITDLETRISIFANPAICQMLGYSEVELTRKKADELHSKEDWQWIEAEFKSVARGEKRFLYNLPFLRKDGATVFFNNVTSHMVIEGRKYMVSFFTDVTERRKIEAALEKSEATYRELVESISEIIFSIDIEGRITYINPAIQRISNYSPKEIIGRPFSAFIHKDDLRQVENSFKGVLVGRLSGDEYRVIDRNGQPRWVHSSSRPVLEKGNLIGIRGIMTDIHERKQREDEIRKLNQDLEQRVRKRTAELEDANREMQSFAYSVSHDLRSPLINVEGMSQALLEDYHDKLDAQGQDYLKRLRSAVKRMEALIDDILKLSRVTRLELNKQKVDLSKLAGSICAEIKKKHPNRKMEFIIAPGLMANADRSLINLALENLLNNAFKFTSQKEQALIEFGAAPKDGQNVFYIKDNGIGFDMEYADKLFVAFQRLHTLSEFPGSGIGLATVRRIIERHGGKIWAEGEVNKGATFYFTL